MTVLCGLAGFALGAACSLLLARRFRGRTVAALRSGQVALWGGTASAVLTAVLTGAGDLAGAPLPLAVVVPAIVALGVLGAGMTTATVVIAQRVLAHLSGAAPNDLPG
jgi:hypothetical protein